MDEIEYSHMYAEEESHWWYAGMRAIVRSLLETSSLRPRPQILDAGCGTGYSLGWFRRQLAGRVVGLDKSSWGLKFCSRRGERHLVCADVAALPFGNASFDLVTSFDVLCQLENRTCRDRALEEFHRVIRPGGLLLMRVPAYEWLRGGHDDGVASRHRFGSRELRDAVARAGFGSSRITFANTILFPAAVVWRLCKRAGLAPRGSDVRPATRGSPWMRATLRFLLELEAVFLRRHRLPFGLSLFVLAGRRED